MIMLIKYSKLRDRRHGTPCRVTWRNIRVVRRPKSGVRKKFRSENLLGFPCKAGQSKVLASLKNFSELWKIGVVPYCCVLDPGLSKAEDITSCGV